MTTSSDEVMTLRMLVYLRYSTTAEKVLTGSSLSALGNIRQERKHTGEKPAVIQDY